MNHTSYFKSLYTPGFIHYLQNGCQMLNVSRTVAQNNLKFGMVRKEYKIILWKPESFHTWINDNA